MKLRKKALIPAIAMVLASVIALSGVTLAWFTTGTTASVSSLDVNVQAAKGIQVSIDANTWKSVITADDLKNAINAGLPSYPTHVTRIPTGEIAPVSSAGNVVDGLMQMFFGGFAKDGNLFSTADIENGATTNSNFASFDLFFKSSVKQELSLLIGQNKSEVVGAAVTTDAAANAGTEKAVRVAFIPMGSAEEPAAARALSVTGTKANIWEPNSKARVDGVDAPANEKLTYNGFTAPFGSEMTGVAVPGEGQIEAVSTFDGEEMPVIELQPGISKVRVYIWLEGQDVDCVNNISFGDFSVALQFSVPDGEGDQG